MCHPLPEVRHSTIPCASCVLATEDAKAPRASANNAPAGMSPRAALPPSQPRATTGIPLPTTLRILATAVSDTRTRGFRRGACARHALTPSPGPANCGQDRVERLVEAESIMPSTARGARLRNATQSGCCWTRLDHRALLAHPLVGQRQRHRAPANSPSRVRTARVDVCPSPAASSPLRLRVHSFPRCRSACCATTPSTGVRSARQRLRIAVAAQPARPWRSRRMPSRPARL